MTNPDKENCEKVLKQSWLGNMPQIQHDHLPMTAAVAWRKCTFSLLQTKILYKYYVTPQPNRSKTF